MNPRRDLRLPDWGPYGKRYAGASHIADPVRGARFDVSVAPGLFRGAVLAPDALRQNGVHPWEAAPGLGHYSYRYELEWKDQLYCDVSFTAVAQSQRLVACEFVNNTDVAHRVVAHLVGSLDFARIGPHREWLRCATVQLPSGATWIDALDHRSVTFARPRVADGLTPDGLLRGERRAHGAVSGSVLAAGFGDNAGDRAVYTVDIGKELRSAVLRLRYRAPEGVRAAFQLSGITECVVELRGSGAMDVVDVEVGALAAGTHDVAMTSLGVRDDGSGSPDGERCEIDGFVIGEQPDVAATQFTTEDLDASAEITPGQVPGSMVLDYPGLGHVYGLCWWSAGSAVTEFFGHDLGGLLSEAGYDAAGVPKPSPLSGSGDGEATQFADVLTRPLMLPPASRVSVYALVCHGERPEVEQNLTAFVETEPAELGRALRDARKRVLDLGANPSGERHDQAQQRMIATLLTNVVYPTYVRRGYVRHLAPGRWWDSLYTWDSGFIGLGLVDIDPPRADDCLNAYLTEPGDSHSAFIHHGSPVPVQQYLAAELFARDTSRTKLAAWYPRLRQQYQFLAGHHPASRTPMPSGLLNTYDYFYNSGGWDDYPAQMHSHAHRLTHSVAPMVTASQAIRVAKLLSLSAWFLGREHDVDGYLADIARLTGAIQQCWDSDAGYFGYGVHDGDGELRGLLRDDAGVNLNMGLDGVYPLVADVCTPQQQEQLLARLFSPERMWTEIGISTVDRSAPYYSPDGYWNGSVWMAHQWFVFKTMLDLARPELAHRIASTALNVWTAETERTYNCWEHFSIATGRGAGWHQFGALSAPVLNFFAAYHRPGNLTTGLNLWAVNRHTDDDHTELTADLLSVAGSSDQASLIACMRPGRRYQATLDGIPARVEEIDDGVLHITLQPRRAARSPLQRLDIT